MLLVEEPAPVLPVEESLPTGAVTNSPTGQAAVGYWVTDAAAVGFCVDCGGDAIGTVDFAAGCFKEDT